VNVVERYLATYRHQQTDRAPIALSYFHAGFGRKHLAKAQDPIEAGIEHQTRYGFDPHLYVRGLGKDWFLAEPGPGCHAPDHKAGSADWHVSEQVTHEPSGTSRTEYTIETPDGRLSCVRVQTPDDFGTIPEPFVKNEEDIELFRHRPHPKHYVDLGRIRQDYALMGDRCWPMASFAGAWTMASFFRGPDTIMFDLYDRPDWVKRFLAILTEYQIELIREIAKAGVDVTLRMDGSFVGFGLSRGMYTEFIQPHDTRIVQAAHDAGLRLHLHICGKKNAFLEDLADTGLDALETLTPRSAAGDIDLADAKRRIGDRVCLMGGFLSHNLAWQTPAEIEEEVRNCLAKAGMGGGYILSPSGRIDPDIPEEHLRAFTAAGRKFGAARPAVSL